MKRRLIGGPKHGEIANYPGNRVEYPVMNCKYDPQECTHPFHTVTYETRKMYLTSSVAVHMLVPVSMTEDEAARALADFIDGTKR